MAWSDSHWFIAFPKDACDNTSALDLGADTHKVALFDNSITPDRTVASASTAYGAGVWAAGGVFDATGWPAVGRNLVTPTWTQSSATATFDAVDTASANSTTTLSAFFGCLVYDDTITTLVADQGICFNYFGGSNSVTNGSAQVVWNASGICAITV